MLPEIEIVLKNQIYYALMKTPDHISNLIRSRGAYAQLETECCLAVVQTLSAPLVLDVGANLGAFCLPVAKHISGLNGEVHCFEPQRHVYQQLCTNIFLNRLDNVYSHNVAVGAENKEVEIPILDFSISQNVGSFSLDEETRGLAGVSYSMPNQFSGSSDRVRQIALDSMGFQTQISFIKVDIEGWELEFFEGARQTLADHDYPIILFEAWEEHSSQRIKRSKILTMLSELGYEFSDLNQNVFAQHSKKKVLNVVVNGASVSFYRVT